MGNFCGECGEKIEPDMIYCPKCGAKTQYEYPQVRGGQTFTPPAYDFRQNTGIAPRTYPNVQPAYQPRSYNTGNGNKLGGASLACGLIGFCCFFGLPLGIIAIILGITGIIKDDRKGPAIGGLIFGIIDIALGVFEILLMFGPISYYYFY